MVMQEHTGKTCPYCQYAIKPDISITVCTGDCKMPHHKECWDENGGCTTFGCSASPAMSGRSHIPSQQISTISIDETSDQQGDIVDNISQDATSSNGNAGWFITIGIVFIAIAILVIFNLTGDMEISGIEETTINFDGGTYTGQVVDGVAEGYGSWEHPEGYRYEGEFKNNKFHGQGTITWVDGSIYEGQLKDDLMHGYGTMTWSDGTVLEGRFEYGEYVGYLAMEEEPKDEIIGNTIFVDVPEYENLNLRSGPGTDYSILDKLRRGTELTILGVVKGSDGDQWFQVRTPDRKEGWVHSNYVTLQSQTNKDTSVGGNISIQTIQPHEPFTYDELGLENLGIDSDMSLADVISIFDEPRMIDDTDSQVGPDPIYYFFDGFTLGYYISTYEDEYHEILGYYEIYSNDIIGPRGIRVGDTAESVLDKYPNEGATEVAECTDLYKCMNLYYFKQNDGSAKAGVYYRDESNGEIIKISYGHGTPASCGGRSVMFTIENGLVIYIKYY